mgnify:CR=1 FL=1
MARPRRRLGLYFPAIQQGIGAALLESDLGMQIQNMTLVANSNVSVNIILNSLLTSNVAVVQAYPHAGFSYPITFWEVTAPTRSAVFLGVRATGLSAGLGNINVPARVFIAQRGE